MLHFLPGPLLGVITLLLFIINTIFWNAIFFPVAILKLLIPIDSWRLSCSYGLNGIAKCWVDGNNFIIALTQRIEWDINQLPALKPDGWYLLVVNHRSWIDIPVLQKIFNHRIPFLKFFLKKELIRVPILGFAWWALDFPFMRRYSRAYLEQHPELRGKDFDTIRKACSIFKRMPVSIINFLEGTRFTDAKKAQQRSPFRHLLLPKAGGIAAVLSEMGDLMSGVLNITLAYSLPNASLWDMLCGKVSRIVVRIELLPVPLEIVGKDYDNDLTAQRDFQDWVNQLWQEKDELLEQISTRYLK